MSLMSVQTHTKSPSCLEIREREGIVSSEPNFSSDRVISNTYLHQDLISETVSVGLLGQEQLSDRTLEDAINHQETFGTRSYLSSAFPQLTACFLVGDEMTLCWVDC